VACGGFGVGGGVVWGGVGSSGCVGWGRSPV